MPKKISFSCDGCGVERKESNHWWTVYSNNYVNHSIVRCEQPMGHSGDHKWGGTPWAHGF